MIAAGRYWFSRLATMLTVVARITAPMCSTAETRGRWRGGLSGTLEATAQRPEPSLDVVGAELGVACRNDLQDLAGAEFAGVDDQTDARVAPDDRRDSRPWARQNPEG